MDRFEKDICPDLKKITELFVMVNEAILRAEEINSEKKADIQVINELRNTLTHLMRIFTAYFEIERDYDKEYIQLNLNKAFGHIYRAGYDTLDWTALSLRMQISEEIHPFSLETIKSVFPEYYRDIRPDLEVINERIVKRRAEKDVGDPKAENFVEYVKIVEKIREYFDTALRKKNSLIDYEKKVKKGERK